jgi:putative ABC transport system substrate-binding protein
VLSSLSEQVVTARTDSVREGFKHAGLVEGKDCVLTLRFANGDNERLPELVRELDGLKPRVYVVISGGVIALHQQLPNAPAVFTGIGVDPVALAGQIVTRDQAAR